MVRGHWHRKRGQNHSLAFRPFVPQTSPCCAQNTAGPAHVVETSAFSGDIFTLSVDLGKSFSNVVVMCCGV